MPKKAVLLLNLGTPDAPSVKAVRRYLKQFLLDPEVIDLPRLIRNLLVRLFILPFRSAKSAHAYASVWTEEGAPLLVYSRHLRNELQQVCELPVYLAMRYGSPSIPEILMDMHREHPEVKDIILLPLYPHYAGSTLKSCTLEVDRVISKYCLPLDYQRIPPFYDNPDYIHALCESARPWLDQDYDHILFSYHGIPERHIRKEDVTGRHCLRPDCCERPSAAHATCYRYQVFRTTKDFVRKAGIPADRYSISFQSRLGKARWLEPYTDKVLVTLANKGIKKLLVICPSFTADCLETLEEIGIRGQDTFKQAGGKELILINCLNSHPAWIKTLAKWIASYQSGDSDKMGGSHFSG